VLSGSLLSRHIDALDPECTVVIGRVSSPFHSCVSPSWKENGPDRARHLGFWLHSALTGLWPWVRPIPSLKWPCGCFFQKRLPGSGHPLGIPSNSSELPTGHLDLLTKERPSWNNKRPCSIQATEGTLQKPPDGVHPSASFPYDLDRERFAE
jgi:hypothetical protein